MATRIINEIKYLKLCNDNNFKLLSLEDNVYFTLRDIFVNISGCDYFMEANSFNSILTNNISYEERNIDFKYSDNLKNKLYIQQLYYWLNGITTYDFVFEENEDKDEYEENYMTKLITFDDWWDQFTDLKHLIKNRFDELYK